MPMYSWSRNGATRPRSTFTRAGRCPARPIGTGLSAAKSPAARPQISARPAIALSLRTFRLGLAAVLIALAAAIGAAAKEGSAAPSPADPHEPPAQVRALINLLADPAVQKWLEKAGVAE